MQSTKTKSLAVLALASMFLMAFAMTAFGAEGETAEYVPALFSTFWALVPPVVAIGLALITKEVYSSLFIGIAVGGILYSGGSFERTVVHIFQDGIIGVLTDESNVGILVFLVILGAMVSLMNKAGGSAAFGRFAAKGIKTRVGAQLATILLGVTIFIDDYFNCLTVGSVMRPVTDKFKVSRAKLAYLIDATAAPVCIIAPISSWAAAVTGFVEGEDGFSIFIQAIPYNFYALLTIVMMVGMVLMKVEFGPMLKHERNAVKGDLFTTEGRPYADESDPSVISRGTVMDLLIPIISLIICCVIGMLYTGGILDGVGLVEAFANCDSALSLVLGSFFTLVFIFAFYMIRRVIRFNEFCESFTIGVKAMIPAIMILCLAWTLSGICSADYLNIGGYVKEVVGGNALVGSLMPALMFVIAAGLAFSTGTSWGTFGILLPIAFAVVGAENMNSLTIVTASILAGAVCGDHVSPISDTTILASAGAQCHHINHVSTQIPYVLCVAACCFLGYLAAGITANGWVGTGVGFAALIVVLVILDRKNKGTKEA